MGGNLLAPVANVSISLREALVSPATNVKSSIKIIYF